MSAMTAAAARAPLLLFDGLCGFCDRTVSFILAHDRNDNQSTMLRFAAIQSEIGAEVIARHPELAGVDSVIWVEPDESSGERVLTKSDAAFRVARYLGAPWSAAGIFRIVPRAIRDYCYDLFARYRYRVFGKFDACKLPPPEWRERFLG